MFHREGYLIIFITLVLSIAAIIIADFYITINWVKWLVQALSLIFLILILQFFRNPKRPLTPRFDEIISPVDGKVVVIEEVFEDEFLNKKCLQVSIFMSPINVHVTRYPASGEVVYSKYHPGKYLVAWHPKSSTENERTTVVINTPRFGKILYRQIAGALARRIINYAKKGDTAVQGSDAGFIKFGSRVDLFLPLDSGICVKLNQKVKGAKTIIAIAKGLDDLS